MILRTLVRDCLYLNWALPLAALPSAPEPLSYETHLWEGERYVFASALLFRHERLQLEAIPAVRISYPQFNLRLYVRDPDGVPSVLFHCLMVPTWVVPAARWIGRQGARAAAFDYPAEIAEVDKEGWRWTVRRRSALRVAGRAGAPACGHGPGLGSWEETVTHLRRRLRGYGMVSGRLRRVDTSQRPVPVWPIRAEILHDGLLERCLDLGAPWPPLHSAWLCPEIPFVFGLGRAQQRRLARSVPAPG